MSNLKMTTDVEYIQKMDTFPNKGGGLSADQVKARFDMAAVDIKRHINDVIAPAIEAMKAVTDVSVSHSAQELTVGQQDQARKNIGAASADDLEKVVRNCPGMKGIPDATSFNRLTANLDQGFYRVHKNDWEDIPGTVEESPIALLVFWYTKYYYVHIAYSMVSNLVAYRIVKADTHTVHKDWFVQTDNVVQYTDQELTDAQQAKARENIGAASENDLHLTSDIVRDIEYTLAEEKIKISALQGIVQTTAQDLDRVAEVVKDTVLVTAQDLTNEQKAQARTNIGAASQVLVDFLLSQFSANGIVLGDAKTGDRYILYVEDGKLTMKKE